MSVLSAALDSGFSALLTLGPDSFVIGTTTIPAVINDLTAGNDPTFGGVDPRFAVVAVCRSSALPQSVGIGTVATVRGEQMRVTDIKSDANDLTTTLTFIPK
jgi:hypothetical protein